jgi:D-alanyl-lipoteichoic acid acyltransferase DltB (MBOAT superfamily)
MLFNSLSYVLFLWVVFVLFWAGRDRRRLKYALLLGASYWFYGQAHWAYVTLLAASTLVDFVAGAAIDRAHDRDDRRTAKSWLAVSLVLNLGLLGTFKYFDFFSASVEELLGSLGVDAATWRLDLLLPVGISFYTFQTLSYTIDIYRRQLRPSRDLLEYAVYVSFFPQLVAGPIVRARDFLPQMAAPVEPTARRVGEGVFQILQGLTKKLVIADLLGSRLVDPVFADGERMASLGAPGVIVLGLGFALQVYGDFGGYSDIAIGSARLLGFSLRPNFDRPLAATTLDGFWRRWHISMTTWFRDYVYVGLGGNRGGLPRACWNMFVTMVVVGLWHGASWNFVLFGAVHGVAMTGVQVFRQVVGEAPFRSGRPWAAASWLMTLLFAALTILFYRAPDLGTWWGLMQRLGQWSHVGLVLSWQIWVLGAVAFAVHMLPHAAGRRARDAYARSPALVQAAVIVVMTVLLFGLRPPGTVPFYYFQF